MSLQSVLITQTSPIFGAEIVGAIEHFWGFSWESSPVWQNPRWCEFLLGVGQVQECIFVGDFTTEGELLSYVLVQIRSIWLGYMGGFVIGGPNFRLLMSNDFVLNKKNSHGLENSPLFAEISRIFIQKWIVFVQYEPLQNLGFTKCNLVWKSFVEPYTLLLDLTLSEDELLAQMKQKGRYNIKLAEKKGVTVIKSIEPEGFDHFIRLLSETLGRDGFAGNSSAYYAGLLATRTHTDEGLYLASKD